VNLKQLTLFQHIAELGSMTRAASVLHVSQPLLTRQMQALEKELGVMLFLRSDKGVQLTPAGLALLERSRTVLQQMRQLQDDIGMYAHRPQGELRLGLPPSLFDLVSVPLVNGFCRTYPEVRVHVQEGLSAWLHEAVLTGRLDTALISDAEPMDMLISRPVLQEPLLLVGPAKSRLRADSTVSAESLLERRMIMTSRPNAMRRIIDQSLAQLPRKLLPSLETNSARMLLELVVQGQYFTVLPYSAVAMSYLQGRVTIAPIQDLSITWTLVTQREQSLSLAGHKLRDNLAELCRNQIRSGQWPGARCLP
jgi:LysR family transcriptional regulator, nitrogen assimilation regulatory protein